MREVLEAKYDTKLEFPGGYRKGNKNFQWGEYGYFLEVHNQAMAGYNFEMFILRVIFQDGEFKLLLFILLFFLFGG